MPAKKPAKPNDVTARTVADEQTKVNQQTFLDAFRVCGNVSAAAKLAGVGRRTHYDWLEADAVYALAFEDAVDEAADLLEGEARRRAVEGLVRYKFNKNGDALVHPEHPEQKYFEREYSDTLLIFLLKGARPDKYADRHLHKGTGKRGAFLLEDIVAGVPKPEEKS